MPKKRTFTFSKRQKISDFKRNNKITAETFLSPFVDNTKIRNERKTNLHLLIITNHNIFIPWKRDKGHNTRCKFS